MNPLKIARGLAVVGLLSVMFVGCDTTEPDWKSATAANTRVAYEDFLKKHPGSVHDAVAKQQALELAWEETVAASSIRAAEEFVQRYPGSQFESAAKNLVATLAWTEAVRVNSIEGFEGFIKQHPSHPLQDEARRYRMELRWRAATSAGSPEAFYQFFSAEDADVDKVAAAARALGPKEMKTLSDRIKVDFDSARANAKALPEVDAVAVRFGAFDFGLAAVEDVERLWIELLSKEKPGNRFTIPEVVEKKGVPRSSFTHVAPAVFDKAKTEFKFWTEKDEAVGSGQYGTPTAVYVTELPKDRFRLSKKALWAMMGFGVVGDKEPEKREELLQLYGAGSIWRYRGAVKSIVGSIDEIQGTGPRGARLTFLLVEGQGLVYVRGSGRVRYSDGRELLLSPLEPGGGVIEQASVQQRQNEGSAAIPAPK